MQYQCICKLRFCHDCLEKHSISGNELHKVISLHYFSEEIANWKPGFCTNQAEIVDFLRKNVQELTRKHTEYTNYVTRLIQEIHEIVEMSIQLIDQKHELTWDFSVLSDIDSAIGFAVDRCKSDIFTLVTDMQTALERLNPCLYHIQKGRISRFDCKLRSWVETCGLNTEVTETGAWDVVVEGGILHTGGMGEDGPSNVVQMIYGSGVVETRENMVARRKEHCGIEVDEYVYVFGGRDSKGKLNTAERYSLRTLQWYQLPNMLVRRFKFNPVRYKDQILLPGGSDKSIESLHISTLQYQLLPFEFRHSSPNLTFRKPQSDQLLTVTSVKYSEWSPTDSHINCMGCQLSIVFTTSPVLYSTRVYLLDYDKVVEVTCDPVSESQVFPLSISQD